MRSAIVVTLLALSAGTVHTTPQQYDPLAIDGVPQSETVELTVVVDEEREIPIKVYLPDSDGASPVVLFSHGLGGWRNGNQFMGDHWAARGYVAVFLQHPGSDIGVWQELPARQRAAALRRAASGENLVLRVGDVDATLNHLERWNDAGGHPLAGRIDTDRIGMSGHSFGALTTQATSGQAYLRGRRIYTDERIKAAIAFSPSSPRFGDPEDAFSQVSIPWMLMTGTLDISTIGNADLESRLAVFPALPHGFKYEIVFYRAEHSAFTDRQLPGDTEPRNPNHHRAILALSTAFWDAYLRDDRAARAWLDGEGPATVLEAEDRWQRK